MMKNNRDRQMNNIACLKKQLLCLVAGMLLFSVPLSAQEPFDLKRCLEIGLEKNYSIRVSRIQQEVSDNNVTLGNAGYLPSVGVSSRYSGTLNDVDQTSRTTGEKTSSNGVNNNTFNTGINLGYDVFKGFTVQSTYEKLKELKRIGELNTRLSVENLIADLTLQYYNLIRQELLLSNLRYALSLSRQRLNIETARFELGAGARPDMLRAQVEFNSDSSRLVQQFQVLKDAQITLNWIMGQDNLDEKICVKDTIIDISLGLNHNELLGEMLDQNTLLQLAKSNITVSELDRKIVDGATYPSLSIDAGYGYNLAKYGSGATKRQQTLGLSYGATLGFNIFDGFNQRRKRLNAETDIRLQQLRERETEQGLRADLLSAYSTYMNNIGLLELERQNVETARENLEVAMDRYRLGELSGIEMREVQVNINDAQARLINVEYQAKAAEIVLLQIAGKITEYL